MQRKCAICKKPKARFKSGLKAYCSPECGAELALKLRKAAKDAEEKAERKVWAEKKKALNDTVPIWTKKAQATFNKYIRLRDFDKPCISCGKYEHELKHSGSGGFWDCGHYRSVGSCPELRFEPKNAHKQCKKCNQYLSGNHVEYRFGIAQRLTKSELAFIEGPHEPKRYRVEDLKEVNEEFKREIKKLDIER